MTILKTMPLTTDIVNMLLTETDRFCDTGFGQDLSNDVKEAFFNQISSILTNYKNIGYSVIGKWNYDTETEQFNYNGLSSIYDNKLLKYYPYLKVLNDEFIAITGRESSHEEYTDNNSVSESGSNNKSKTKVDDFSNTTNGTNRSAHEESPITSAPITSAPTESSQWNLSNPTSKDGEQFDHHNTSHNSTNVIEGETISNNEIGNKSGNRTAYSDNPEQMLKILKFNIENLNLTRICYLVINSIIEEKNTIY